MLLFRLKLSDMITVQNRDIYGKSQGAAQDASISANESVGGFSGVGDGAADAVFLDVPEPWLALHHVKRVLRAGRNLCCYSPCIEQVMKTCEKMRELGFHSIRMMEVRQRPFDARVFQMETLDVGLGSEENERENARSVRDPLASHQQWTHFPSSVVEDNKSNVAIANDNNEEEDDGSDESEKDSDAADPSSKKRKREEPIESHARENAASEGLEVGEDIFTAEGKRRPYKNLPKAAVNGQYTMHIARPLTQMKGHTAFLTFAVAPVSSH